MATKTTTRRTSRTTRSRNGAPAAATPAPSLEVLTEPHELSEEELQLISDAGSPLPSSPVADAEDDAPTLMPPSVRGTAQGAESATADPDSATAGTTITGQRITALWAEQTSRKASVHLQTAGWKKLSTRTDFGSTVLTILAAHARATGIAPTLVETPAGTIDAMYAW
ncbi:hypothetical protein [Luteipulveratus flavus]|uniref:Uncharacterized protein n=1 Tax=Luteipulveratus flavus TaxID=3031728 RepID=A0ABT6C9X9_9MICO|nr:hypothetical protein [Luteipulveratus sp. YIM 133296]MDF8265157.1 hypothetical protein [Luteipulveratus sp. YIM 133296]